MWRRKVGLGAQEVDLGKDGKQKLGLGTYQIVAEFIKAIDIRISIKI